MRNGVVIFRSPEAPARTHSQACLILSHRGFTCQVRTRYDGITAVAFQRDEGQPDVETAEVQALMEEAGVWDGEQTDIKAFD